MQLPDPIDKTHHIISFLKFGAERDMLDLFHNGTIYMNPIDKFRAIEDAQLRGDSYEGISRIWNYPPGQFSIPQINYTGNYLSMHLREAYEHVLGNIYSLYCISSYGFPSPDDISIDPRVLEFGTHTVWIKDLPVFFKRIKKALKIVAPKYKHGFVHYYDKNKVNGKITVYQKPQEFEYQKEFRFYVLRQEITPFIFRIGSLADIAEIMPTKVALDARFEKKRA